MAASAAVTSSPLSRLRARLAKFKRLLGEPVSATRTTVQVPHFSASRHSSEARGRRRRQHSQHSQQPRRHAASPAVRLSPPQEKDTDWGDLEWRGPKCVERSGFESDDSLDVALRRLRATTTQVSAFQNLDVRVPSRCPLQLDPSSAVLLSSHRLDRPNAKRDSTSASPVTTQS